MTWLRNKSVTVRDNPVTPRRPLKHGRRGEQAKETLILLKRTFLFNPY